VPGASPAGAPPAVIDGPAATPAPATRKVSRTEGPSEGYLEFWRERHLCTLTTIRRDGGPHVVPVGVTYDHETGIARIITNGRSRKVAHILAAAEREAAPGPEGAAGAGETGGARVAVCQVDRGRWATLEGRARVRTEPEAVADAEARYAERYGRTPRPNPERVAIEITVTRLLGRAGPHGSPARGRDRGHLSLNITSRHRQGGTGRTPRRSRRNGRHRVTAARTERSSPRTEHSSPRTDRGSPSATHRPQRTAHGSRLTAHGSRERRPTADVSRRRRTAPRRAHGRGPRPRRPGPVPGPRAGAPGRHAARRTGGADPLRHSTATPSRFRSAMAPLCGGSAGAIGTTGESLRHCGGWQ
jgi:F420H(2)-dependent biliverdin reductase